MFKPHPTNPHGVLVPCANCGREIHAPRDDFTKGGIDPANLTCRYDCMVALRDKKEYAEELVRLVNEELPENLVGLTSWTDLHGVFDANEYLILADEKFGRDFNATDEQIAFHNEAIAIAEVALFGASRKVV